jgi:transcriptional regulator with XRE-family HTH domain
VVMDQNGSDAAGDTHPGEIRALLLEHERAFGRNVARLREERDWSQAELARRLTALGFEMHQTTVAKLEAGKRPVRLAEMYALAQVFKLPPSVMFSPPEETALLELLSKYEEQYIVNEETFASMDEIAVKLQRLLVEHPPARDALRDALTKTFPNAPQIDKTTLMILDPEFSDDAGIRWWEAFHYLHGKDEHWRDAVEEARKSDSDVLRARIQGVLKGADRGEHQETT